MILLNGIEMLGPTHSDDGVRDLAQIIDWVSEHIPLHVAIPWVYRAFPGKKLARITWPTGFYPAAKVVPNRLYYYPGAMRWSYCHLLAAATDLEAIRPAAFGSAGDQNHPLTLRFEEVDDLDVPVGHIETSLYLLPPTKLIGVDREPDETLADLDGLYLLSLVDERFWWGSIPMPEYAIGDETTWADLIALCASAVGEAIAVGPIDGAYLKPDAKTLNLQYEVVPPVLDCVLYNVGLRLVRNLDGSYVAMDAATSAARHAANLAAAAEQRVAGGARFQAAL